MMDACNAVKAGDLWGMQHRCLFANPRTKCAIFASETCFPILSRALASGTGREDELHAGAARFAAVAYKRGLPVLGKVDTAPPLCDEYLQLSNASQTANTSLCKGQH